MTDLRTRIPFAFELAPEHDPEHELLRSVNDELAGAPLTALSGVQLLPREVVRLLLEPALWDRDWKLALKAQQPWSDYDKLATMAEIIFAESGGWTEAVGTVNPNGTQDFGLIQGNNGHAGALVKLGLIPNEAAFPAAMFDVSKAMPFARYLYVQGGYDFEAWAAGPEGNKSHERFTGWVALGLCNYRCAAKGLTPVPYAGRA